MKTLTKSFTKVLQVLSNIIQVLCATEKEQFKLTMKHWIIGFENGKILTLL